MANYFLASLAALISLTLPQAWAQQTLKLDVQKEYGDVALAEQAIGCFDPLAALKLDTDVIAGEISDMTENAFSVGSCIALDNGKSLKSAQYVTLQNQRFVRARLTGDVMVYIPEWSAALEGAEDRYDAQRAAVAAPMVQVADALETEINAAQECADATSELNDRIAEYNERVAERTDKDEPVTGSRLASAGQSTTPTRKIVLADNRYEDLRREGRRLQQEAEAIQNRCEDVDVGRKLDRDYMTYLGVGA